MNNQTFPHTIYKISFPNGKSYIGYTGKGIEERKKEHLRSAKKPRIKYPVHKAIKSFGEKNVKFEIVNVYLTEELAYNRESYYIKLYNSSISQNGYNVAEGGRINKFKRPYRQRKVKVLNNPNLEFDSLELAAKYYKVIPQAIYRVCSGKRSHLHGDVLCYSEDYESRKLTFDYSKIPLPKKTIVIDSFGNIYNSLTEAGKSIGSKGSTIQNGIDTKRPVKGVSFCAYVDGMKKCPEYSNRKIKVHCKQTNITYSSLVEVSNMLKISLVKLKTKKNKHIKFNISGYDLTIVGGGL